MHLVKASQNMNGEDKTNAVTFDSQFSNLGNRKLKLVEKLGVKERSVLSIIKKITKSKEPFKMDPDYPIDLNNQSVRVPSEKGEFIIRRAELKDGKLITGLLDFQTVPEMFYAACKKHGDKPFHGTRKILGEVDDKMPDGRPLKRLVLSDFIWKSYNEIQTEVLNMAGFFLKLGYTKGSKLAIFADTQSEWLISALAINSVPAIIVTVYSTLSDESIVYALEQTKAEAIVVDSKSLSRVVALQSQLTHIKQVICMSDCTDSQSASTDKVKIVKVSDDYDFSTTTAADETEQPPKPVYFEYAVAMKVGREHRTEISFEYELQSRDDICLIMYTSGSTGLSKGVVIQHKSVLATCGAATSIKPKMWYNNTYPAYLPLAHSFEFISENALCYFGCKIGYCRPTTLTDTSPMVAPNIKGDLTLLKPTVAIFVPLLVERLKKGIIEKISSRGKLPCALVEYGYNQKLSLRDAGYDSPKIDKILFKKIYQVIGGALKFVIVGSASLPPQTEEFANVCFGLPMKQGYGLTESCIAGTLANFDDRSIGNCGPPMGSVDLKLIPWEEGGYSPEDKPNPRGEILLAGESIALGYFDQPELTEKSFVTDPDTGVRWFYTGDIGEVLPNGTVRIIDRKKDIIKLKHGEYISLVQVESTLSKNTYIELLVAIPSAESDHLVLIVVPSRSAAADLAAKLNLPKSENITDAFDDPTFIKTVTESILQTCKDNKLGKFETPKCIHLVKDYWTPDTNLVTPTMKTKRPELARYYKHLL